MVTRPASARSNPGQNDARYHTRKSGVLVNVNSFRSAVRGAMIGGQQAIGRGSAVHAPKTDFGSKLGAAPRKLSDAAFPTAPALRAQLDALHGQIRGTNDAARLGDLVDEYVMVAAQLVTTPGVFGGLIPGGAILSAAVSAVGQMASSGQLGSHWGAGAG